MIFEGFGGCGESRGTLPVRAILARAVGTPLYRMPMTRKGPSTSTPSRCGLVPVSVGWFERDVVLYKSTVTRVFGEEIWGGGYDLTQRPHIRQRRSPAPLRT